MAEAQISFQKIGHNDDEVNSGGLFEGNIQRLKDIFPQIVTDGKVDFDVLRQLLGDAVDDGEERYGLNWNGKKKARAFALTPGMGTLRPAPEESVDWDDTQNILIEGDNLEVLKLLRRSYAGKVKLIYIDPPYNTGNDFVYPDNYKDNIGHYLRASGQRGKNDEALSSEKADGGRLHTNWLNMMYPRLMLAKELLRDDGLIFVSIDDTEVASLRQLMAEIFGEENYEGHVHWRRRHNQPNDPTKMLGLVAEHLIVFARNKEIYKEKGVGKVPLTGKFSNADRDPRGAWASKPWKVGSDQNGSRYIITLPSGEEIDGEWMGDLSTYEELLSNGRIIFPKDGRGAPRKKYYEFERQKEGQSATNWWDHEAVGHNQEGNAEVSELFHGVKNVFSNPKPVRFIQRICQVANVQDDDIVMDFFAGSGTTGHAMMAQNAADDGIRRYILVQFPETLNPEKREQKKAAEFCDSINKPRNIAELTKERLRRAGQKIREDHPDVPIDTGFRVYKLDTSNLKPWQPDSDNPEQAIWDAVDNILPDRSEDDLLVELLLKTGGDLILPMEKRILDGRTVYALDGGRLMVCLADISAESVEVIGNGISDWAQELSPSQITLYFRDSGIGATGNSAATKANLGAILRQRLGDRITKIMTI